jgi:hypothetical protein
MRNLARCLLAQGIKPDEAIETARETMEICRSIGEKQTVNTAGLVLAEAHLLAGNFDEYEAELQAIEESSPASEFFVLGSVQRLRGLAALAAQAIKIWRFIISAAASRFLNRPTIFITRL